MKRDTKAKGDSIALWVLKKNHTELKLRAVTKGMMMTDLANEALEYYFKNHSWAGLKSDTPGSFVERGLS